ncbi:MAG TPA: hypothetical protein ENN76_01095 [Euryarchaeota archaeon]|nr:hypothetical protein [Euryarchaeota archaeon]
MSYDEAEDFVLDLLKEKGELTTGDIEDYARTLGKTCPDKTILVLTKLRAKGQILGDFDISRRTWVWKI